MNAVSWLISTAVPKIIIIIIIIINNLRLHPPKDVGVYERLFGGSHGEKRKSQTRKQNVSQNKRK